MKRSDFLKRLGIGLGAVIVAPRVLAEMPAKEKKIFPKITTVGELDPMAFKPRRLSSNIKVSDEFINTFGAGPYYKGDVFVRNGHRYVLISRGFSVNGEAILKLRPLTFTPNPDVNVLVSNLGSFRHTTESCLLKYNND